MSFRRINKLRSAYKLFPITETLTDRKSYLQREYNPDCDCLTTACANPKSFWHAHHSYYQIACILGLLERRQAGFEWLERSVSSGFACWTFFLKDPHLKNLRELPEFEVLVSSLQAKYPDHLGLL